MKGVLSVDFNQSGMGLFLKPLELSSLSSSPSSSSRLLPAFPSLGEAVSL